MQFRLTGESVKYQWHEVWTAAVAAMTVCVPQGKTGEATIRGE